MLDSQGYLKLVDFGLAKDLMDGSKTFTVVGTVSWFARCWRWQALAELGRRHSWESSKMRQWCECLAPPKVKCQLHGNGLNRLIPCIPAV